MHILFREDQPTIVRRLLQIAAGFRTETQILQNAVAAELNLSPAELAVKSYKQTNGVWHTEIMFKGLDAIKLGYLLEKRTLENTFAPLPNYPIHRLYMEEIFDCGEHAVGATHSAPVAPLKFSLPDSGWESGPGSTILANQVVSLAPNAPAVPQNTVAPPTCCRVKGLMPCGTGIFGRPEEHIFNGIQYCCKAGVTSEADC